MMWRIFVSEREPIREGERENKGGRGGREGVRGRE